MNAFKKLLIGTLAASVLAVGGIGLVACNNDDDKDKDKDKDQPTGVVVAGGYEYMPPDQGGYGLELNLYEDGTFYYSAFTMSVTYGKYTSEKATGKDADGRTILYTVTFSENDIFNTPAEEGATQTKNVHQIVCDSENKVYLTAMYDTMSMETYDLKKTDDYCEEVVQTVAEYWSTAYETDSVKLTLYSNDTYALDGINGAGQAGSLGTYTTSTAASGVVTYTLKDEDDATKTYTLVIGEETKLTVGTTEYTMTDLDPEAVLSYTFEGVIDYWVTVKIFCYDNGKFTSIVDMGQYGAYANVSGTYGEPSATTNEFTFIFNDGRTASAALENGSYVLKEFDIGADYADPSFGLSSTILNLTYTPKATMSYTFTGTDSLGYQSAVELICMSDGTCSLNIDLSQKWTDASGTWKLENNVFTITLVPMDEDGQPMSDEYKTVYTAERSGNNYSFTYKTYSFGTGNEDSATLTCTLEA